VMPMYLKMYLLNIGSTINKNKNIVGKTIKFFGSDKSLIKIEIIDIRDKTTVIILYISTIVISS
ncbi:hypothetical protein, partial [Staphylococcus simulans]